MLVKGCYLSSPKTVHLGALKGGEAGAREMTQQFRELAVLPENLDSSPSTHFRAEHLLFPHSLHLDKLWASCSSLFTAKRSYSHEG